MNIRCECNFFGTVGFFLVFFFFKNQATLFFELAAFKFFVKKLSLGIYDVRLVRQRAAGVQRRKLSH